MRIDRLHVRNIKGFKEKSLKLNPRFTLLVGDNGAGKTTLLDALAVAAGVWLVKPPDSTLVSSGRNILKEEIRLEPLKEEERTQLIECKPVTIEAEGEIADRSVKWLRQISTEGTRTSNADASEALNLIRRHYSRVHAGDKLVTPVIAYYGAGRSWLPYRSRQLKRTTSFGPVRRWEAFYDCFAERIRQNDLQKWFQRELFAFAKESKWRPGYDIVKGSILHCIPGADELWYDVDRAEVVLRFGSKSTAYSNLSAGQRMMVALIADIAIKAVTQNSHLIGKDSRRDVGTNLPQLLQQTPGLVLIDEIDAHLHPRWQRRVVGDLKHLFPKIQFVCTSHSPFVIQSLDIGEVRSLDKSGPLSTEYANVSIEDIAEEIQKVTVPQQSERARKLSETATKYFSPLKKREKDGISDELKRAEFEYRKAS